MTLGEKNKHSLALKKPTCAEIETMCVLNKPFVSLPPPTPLGGLSPPCAPKPQQPPQLGSGLLRNAPRPQQADEGVPDLEEVPELKENSDFNSDKGEPIKHSQVDGLLGLLDSHRRNLSKLKADGYNPERMGLPLDPCVSLDARVAKRRGRLLAKTLRYIQILRDEDNDLYTARAIFSWEEDVSSDSDEDTDVFSDLRRKVDRGARHEKARRAGAEFGDAHKAHFESESELDKRYRRLNNLGNPGAYDHASGEYEARRVAAFTAEGITVAFKPKEATVDFSRHGGVPMSMDEQAKMQTTNIYLPGDQLPPRHHAVSRRKLAADDDWLALCFRSFANYMAMKKTHVIGFMSVVIIVTFVAFPSSVGLAALFAYKENAALMNSAGLLEMQGIFTDPALATNALGSVYDCSKTSTYGRCNQPPTMVIPVGNGKTAVSFYVSESDGWLNSLSCWYQLIASNTQNNSVWVDQSHVECFSNSITVNYKAPTTSNDFTSVCSPGKPPLSVAASGFGYNVVLSNKWTDPTNPNAACPAPAVNDAIGQHGCRLYYEKSYSDPKSYCSWLMAQGCQGYWWSMDEGYFWSMDEWICTDANCGYGGANQPTADQAEAAFKAAGHNLPNQYSCGHNPSDGWWGTAATQDKMVNGLPTGPNQPFQAGAILSAVVGLPAYLA
ncbi:hypothetical protein T492DRAFT_887356 [Pavlovales sp. CCMP2436]|nr:hypothetical protein T492DRAFT_887356 [Pavlovales sp. CCMP2436]